MVKIAPIFYSHWNDDSENCVNLCVVLSPGPNAWMTQQSRDTGGLNPTPRSRSRSRLAQTNVIPSSCIPPTTARSSQGGPRHPTTSGGGRGPLLHKDICVPERPRITALIYYRQNQPEDQLTPRGWQSQESNREKKMETGLWIKLCLKLTLSVNLSVV